MFCPGCGEQTAEGDGFCRKCGRKIGSAVQVRSGAAAPAVTVSNVYKGKNKQILGAVLAVVGLVAGIASCSITMAAQAPSTADDTSMTVFFGLFIVGCVIYFMGRAQHWYHN